jgi:MFS family permease
MEFMNIDYKKQLEERNIIKKETRTSKLIALGMLASILVYAFLAYFVKLDFNLEKNARENIYWILIFVIILILIGILSVRKTIYYSTRMIKEGDTLTQILRKWRQIDIILMAVGETIPILGLIITWLGMPFARTGFIFLVSAILMIILMPVGIKVRSKLDILRRHIPGI